MNGSPRRHPLVAGALAAALACVGAVVVAAAPASARPYGDCDSVQTYTITNVSSGWKPTSLNSGKPVRGPGIATIPRGKTWRAFASSFPSWFWTTGEIGTVFAKVNASYPYDLAVSTGDDTTAAKSLAVPRGKTQRLQQYVLSRTFTAKKYAATNMATCARGRLLYSVTMTAPLITTSLAGSSVKYALV